MKLLQINTYSTKIRIWEVLSVVNNGLSDYLLAGVHHCPGKGMHLLFKQASHMPMGYNERKRLEPNEL